MMLGWITQRKSLTNSTSLGAPLGLRLSPSGPNISTSAIIINNTSNEGYNMAVSKYQLSVISQGMSEMAATHKNDTISNALARVSQKIDSIGGPFSKQLTKEDMMVIAYYHQNKKG
jgi:hypothetical protein